MNEGLSVFVDRLLEERGVDGLDTEIVDQLKNDLLERVEDRINATILENMPSHALEDFEKLLDSDASDEEVQKFCAEKIPNLDEIIAATLLEFRDAYFSN